jgi:hypothetical protein
LLSVLACACHTFYGPPKLTDQVVLALSGYRDGDSYLLIILPPTHQTPERTKFTNSRGEGKQEEITLG